MACPLGGFLATLLLCSECPTESTAGSRTSGHGDNLSPYGGLGTWVDIYDSKQWTHPSVTVRRMKAVGAAT